MEQLATGSVQRILTRAFMLGKIKLTCLIVSVGLEGRLVPSIVFAISIASYVI